MNSNTPRLPLDAQLLKYSQRAQAKSAASTKQRSRPQKSWLAYTAAAGAAVAGPAAANAAIVYSGPQSVQLSTSNPDAHVQTDLDIDGDGNFDFRLTLDRSSTGYGFFPTRPSSGTFLIATSYAAARIKAAAPSLNNAAFGFPDI